MTRVAYRCPVCRRLLAEVVGGVTEGRDALVAVAGNPDARTMELRCRCGAGFLVLTGRAARRPWSWRREAEAAACYHRGE